MGPVWSCRVGSVLKGSEQLGTIKPKCWTDGLDWIGYPWPTWLQDHLTVITMSFKNIWIMNAAILLLYNYLYIISVPTFFSAQIPFTFEVDWLFNIASFTSWSTVTLNIFAWKIGGFAIWAYLWNYQHRRWFIWLLRKNSREEQADHWQWLEPIPSLTNSSCDDE